VNLKLTSAVVVVLVVLVLVVGEVFVLLVLRHVPRFCHTFPPILSAFLFCSLFRVLLLVCSIFYLFFFLDIIF